MIRKIQILILSTLLSCVTINTSIESDKYQITYSDVNEPIITKIQIQYNNHYWFSYNFKSNKDVNESIHDELKNYPGAKGIKNLKIRIYNNSWLTFSVLPNPLALMTSGLYMYLGRPLGFSNKSIFIEGEVY
ncbi:hypothetical protein [Leptospira levettii]|uniref:hypothetical protein n=1 Tax=Leptospira levettii TaxID=2023178 RepID=UPI000C2AC939|nr:hypothetical protein [Leptospira levettii]PJZ86804.1 hypothetical protein CH368_20110 [Leptospira levettii]